MIKQIIIDNNITSHDELDKHLAKISNCKHYWSYPYDVKDEPRLAELLSKCVVIEFDNVKRYYENEII